MPSNFPEEFTGQVAEACMQHAIWPRFMGVDLASGDDHTCVIEWRYRRWYQVIRKLRCVFARKTRTVPVSQAILGTPTVDISEVVLRDMRAKLMKEFYAQPNDFFDLLQGEKMMGEETIPSEADERVRMDYRVLTEKEKVLMRRIKQMQADFIRECEHLGNSREISIAKTKAEEASMWAVKHLTKP